MKKAQSSTTILEKLLYKHKIATMDELKTSLNTLVDMTVYRQLKQLPYLKSYSDRGKYYTLEGIPDFDQRGLWQYQSVLFSRYGTLVETLKQFIQASDSGFFENELEQTLQVCVRVPLLKLWKEKAIEREKVMGRYLYYSVIPEVGMRQLHQRRERLEAVEPAAAVNLVGREVLYHELKAAIVLFFSVLDEKQRRLYAGLESLMCGYGGDSKVAELLDLDVHTVAKGRKEILQRDMEVERVRRAGGGRKPLEKKRRK